MAATKTATVTISTFVLIELFAKTGQVVHQSINSGSSDYVVSLLWPLKRRGRKK